MAAGQIPNFSLYFEVKFRLMAEQKQKILILGGGFGGVKAALLLASQPSFEVSLISDQTDFRFYPTLYRAATGGKRAASAIALTEIFGGKDVKLIHDSAEHLDRAARSVQGHSGHRYDFDILIIALGSVTNFFGIKGLDKYAYGIKTFEEAVRLKNHLHRQLVEERRPDLHYVVIGGGPTGVELAGALPGYIRHIMKRHGLAGPAFEVDLVEAAARVTPRMKPAYSRAIQRRLRRLGVKLRLAEMVKAETADDLMIGGRPLKSHSVVWTAGVTNHPFLKNNGFNLSEHGKAIVDAQLAAAPDIYIIGDNADTLYSGMAQTALFDAHFVVANLKRQAAGRGPEAYKAKRPIYVTPIGPQWAAVSWGKIQIYGRLGWLLRGAADFIAYHDLEPWQKASRHWVAEMGGEESCPVCVPRE